MQTQYTVHRRPPQPECTVHHESPDGDDTGGRTEGVTFRNKIPSHRPRRQKTDESAVSVALCTVHSSVHSTPRQQTRGVYTDETDAVCVCVSDESPKVGASPPPVGLIARRKGCVRTHTPLLLLLLLLVSSVVVVERIRNVYRAYTPFISNVYAQPTRWTGGEAA